MSSLSLISLFRAVPLLVLFFLVHLSSIVCAGDKMVLGNQGDGCGPKFIFKSAHKKAKEFFILNECKEERQPKPKTVVQYVPVYRDARGATRPSYSGGDQTDEPSGSGIFSAESRSMAQFRPFQHRPLALPNRAPWRQQPVRRPTPLPAYEPIMQRYLASRLGPYFPRH